MWLSPLTWFLIMLTPASGVVSGGRAISFGMKSGLIPVSQWICIPGVPVKETASFTEITFQGGPENTFRVASSGDTADLNPLISSRVTREGFAAQIAVGAIALYCINDSETGSYSLSCKNAVLGVRGSSISDLQPVGEYNDNSILVAATENTSALGFSIPVGEGLEIGPAYTRDRTGGDLWFIGEVTSGPVKIVSAPAIDEVSSYRRLYGKAEYGSFHLIYGWDGSQQFGELSVGEEGFISALSFPVPGVMVGCQPSDHLLILLSHCESGYFQGEIQGEYQGLTAGIELGRSPGNAFEWGFSVGIDAGSREVTSFSVSDTTDTWFSRIAVTPR